MQMQMNMIEKIKFLEEKVNILGHVKGKTPFFMLLNSWIVFLKQDPVFFDAIAAIETDKKAFYAEYYKLQEQCMKEFVIAKEIICSSARERQIDIEEGLENPFRKLQDFLDGKVSISGKRVDNLNRLLAEAASVLFNSGDPWTNKFRKSQNGCVIWEFSPLYPIITEKYVKISGYRRFKVFYHWSRLAVVPEIFGWESWGDSSQLEASEENVHFYTDYIDIHFGPLLAKNKTNFSVQESYYDSLLVVFQYILDWGNGLLEKEALLFRDEEIIVSSSGKSVKFSDGRLQLIKRLIDGPRHKGELAKAFSKCEANAVKSKVKRINDRFTEQTKISSKLIVNTGDQTGTYKLNDSEFLLKFSANDS
jgi:hypothetical protein